MAKVKKDAQYFIDKYGYDPFTCDIELLRKEVTRYKDDEDYWNTMQLSAKRFINSVYGVFGSAYFNLANTDIAESITLQGQDLIKFSVNAINKYFREKWPKDVEGHKRTSKIMLEDYPDFDAANFEYLAGVNQLQFETLQIYGDTDSAYITLQPLIDSYHIPESQQIDFCLAVYNAVMKDYLDECFNKYAEFYHCKENLENFELEKVSRSVIMLAKKNYMCDVAWVDSGTYFKPVDHVTYTGFDVVKGSCPNYCRKELKAFTEFVFTKINSGGIPTIGEIVQKVREIKKRFCMQAPDDISKTMGISDYDSYIYNDKDENGFIPWTDSKTKKKVIVPINVRAAAIYNNLLYTKQRKYLSKYETLKAGDKVRFYYINEDDVFGFVPDNFPMEFAPPINVDIQFEKMLLSPINRIVTALGYDEIPNSLTYSVGLW